MTTRMRLLILAMIVVVWNVGPIRALEKPRLTIVVQKKHIDFLTGKQLVGRYHIGAQVAKPYFWPLNNSYGTPITRGWPMVPAKDGESTDHPHQKSAWFCHGDVIPEGMKLKHKIRGVAGVDFWSETKGHGKIVCTKVGKPVSQPGHVQITTHNEWLTADTQKIMEETRTIHLYQFGKTYLLVFEIDLHASVVPITFGDTKEGSMGVRVNDAITEVKTVNFFDGEKTRRKQVKGEGLLENAEGKTSMRDCWGQLSSWCDYSGPVEGKTVGIALFDDPSNAAPAYWHSRDYGLMAANPFGRAKSGFPAAKKTQDRFKLAKGNHLQLRYGILIHPGNAKDGKVKAFYHQFVKLGPAKE